MIQRILVGTTTSEGTAVLETAAELAEAYGAELIVLQVEPLIDARRVFDPDGVPETPDRLIPLRRDFPGLRVRSQRASGRSLRAVVQAAKEERPDLIVVPCGARGLLSRRDSTALAEAATCPIVLIAS